MTMTYEPAPGRTAPCIWDGCTERMWSWRNPSMCYRHAKPYVAGMRALASLMYWARLERQCRLIPARRGWRYVSREVFTTLRVDALGQAIIDSCLPPGLEWTR